MKTELQTQVTRTKKLEKFVHAVSEIRLQTDIGLQTDRHFHHNTPLPYLSRVINRRIRCRSTLAPTHPNLYLNSNLDFDFSPSGSMRAEGLP